MSKDMTIVIGGVTLPKPSTFKRSYIPNETDIETLGGGLYTDFINNRREWVIGWKNLLEDTDFEAIKSLYFDQYQNETYPLMTFEAYSIEDVPVKMNIAEQNIKLNGTIVENFLITIKEQYAIS